MAQDVIVRDEDCGTKEHIEMPVLNDDGRPNGRSRSLAAIEIKTKRGRSLVPKGELITQAHIDEIVEAFGEEEGAAVPVRSVLKCRPRGSASGATGGLRHRQGGRDRRRGGHHRRPVDRRAGHAATCGRSTPAAWPARTSARPPACRGAVRGPQAEGQAELATVEGTASVEETDKGLKVTITDAGGEEHAYAFPRRTRLLVSKNQKVTPGDQLNEGSIYPHDLLAYGGADQAERRTATEVYLVKEVQKVYKSQGVDIDKHIEVIVRQMMKKVRIDQKGDTTYLPGQFVDRNELLG